VSNGVHILYHFNITITYRHVFFYDLQPIIF